MPAAYIASIYLGKEELAKNHLGSGILLGPRLVLTCEHVVENIGPATALTVKFHGQEKGLKANVKAGSKDKGADLALIELKVDAKAAAPGWAEHVDEGHVCQVVASPQRGPESVDAVAKITSKWALNLEKPLDKGCSGGAVVRLVDGDPHCIGVVWTKQETISHAHRMAHVEQYLAAHGITLPVAAPAPTPRRYNTRPYFAELAQETGEIDLYGLGVDPKGTRQPEMDALYIPLRTSSQGKPERKARVGAGGSTTLETALKNRLLLLAGEAGSGKTTFLRRIAWELCENKPRRKTQRKKISLPCPGGFPMFIRVSVLDKHIHESNPKPYQDETDPRWLAHYLASQPGASEGGLDEGFFREKLRLGNSMLLLDGLDEAASERRRGNIAALVTRAAAGEGCRYVVSTRPQPDPRHGVPTGFTTCDVLPLDDPGISEFLTTWCRWLARDAAYLAGLRRDVSRTPSDLRSNPFMLTALAVVYLQNKHLPEQRAELYHEIVRWLGKQAAKRWGKPGYTDREILRCLQRLALAMQLWPDEAGRNGRVTIISINDAAPIIAERFQRGIEESIEFLERAREASGILTLRAGKLAFWHKTFQEYLAAVRFTELHPAEEKTALARRLIYLPEGREMLPLAAMRMQDDDYLPALFEALIADALGKPLPEQAHATGVLGSMLRDLKSTGWVLPTRADERYRALLKNVMAVFDRTSVGIPLQSRLEAAEALGAAGDHRLRTPDQEDYWVRVKGNGNKIADFAIGRFPVTVQEYLLYLEAKPQAEKPREWDEQETFRNWPVAGVSRHEAMDYCAWATEQSGFAVTLPTDAQWEWAAAGPEDRLYPWGDEDPTPEHANYRGTGIRPKPTPVGLFPAGNTPGKEPIYDLAGNVWEWTRTVYGAKKEEQGVRGGSFYYVARALRAAYRVDFVASFRYNFIGFRCIRE